MAITDFTDRCPHGTYNAFYCAICFLERKLAKYKKALELACQHISEIVESELLSSGEAPPERYMKSFLEEAEKEV